MNRKFLVLIFVVIVAIAFAIFTDNRWEDWYITFRASKNLAMGNGLVYTVGQRVHSFTSPIGTLIPAFLSYITKNKNDDYVIWLYRAVNISMLGITALLLLRMSKKLDLTPLSVILVIALLSTNILIIAFSINGMETAFMMFFISAIIYLLFVPTQYLVFKLGIALAGIMYTRPDGFIYAGSLMAGLLIFRATHTPKKIIIVQYLKAICIGLVVYLPWVFWAWQYYGSPVPHTIIAKAMFHNYSLPYLVFKFITLPATILIKGYTGDAVFMPPLYYIGGWHYVEIGSRILSCLSLLPIFLPFVSASTRVLSLSLYILHFYLIFISGQNAMPWYVSNISIITIVCLALLLNQFHKYLVVKHKSLRSIKLFTSLTIGYSILTLMLGAWQLRLQQQIIENNHRKQIGIWLKEQAINSKETVFLECLGYIGFYSGLKMYDYPGLSSPEVVNSNRKLKDKDYAFIINDLKPDWLVLRPDEENFINRSNPAIFRDLYTKAKTFDVREQVSRAHLLFGERWLMSDACFDVFKKKK